jgi:hypothetical protein
MIGAGIYLPGNATRALRALGLESAVAEWAAPISHQRLCGHRGRLLADIDLIALWRDVEGMMPALREWRRTPPS